MIEVKLPKDKGTFKTKRYVIYLEQVKGKDSAVCIVGTGQDIEFISRAWSAIEESLIGEAEECLRKHVGMMFEEIRGGKDDRRGK